MQNHDNKKKWKTNYLAGLSADLLKKQIIDLMDIEKPYLCSTLKIDDLAQKVGLNNHQLSELLNVHFDMNFNSFINSYRITEIEKRLKMVDYQNLTLLAIAKDSGFNSSTAFYRCFKKEHNKPPKKYIASYLIESDN